METPKVKIHQKGIEAMNLDATKKKIEGFIQYTCFETYYDKDKKNEEGYFSVHCRITLKYPLHLKSFDCQVISLNNKTESEAKEEAFNHLICDIRDYLIEAFNETFNETFKETFNEMLNEVLTSPKTIFNFFELTRP